MIRRFSFLVLAVSLFPPHTAPAAEPSMAVPLVPVERQPLDDPFAGDIAEAAQRFHLPAAWIRAVIAVESGGHAREVSPKGAMGLMQIMPDTWADLRDRHALGDDPFEPRANILAGAAYLREMLDRYGSAGFLAAYNAGPQRYEDHLATGRPLPAETRAYLVRLMPMIGAGAVETAGNPVPKLQDALFVGHAGDAVKASSTGLFVRFREETGRP